MLNSFFSVSSSENIKALGSDVIDDDMSPTLVPSRFSLNLENLVSEQYDKENAKPSRKYSVVREKHLQKFIRLVCTFNPNLTSVMSTLRTLYLFL